MVKELNLLVILFLIIGIVLTSLGSKRDKLPFIIGLVLILSSIIIFIINKI